MNKLYEQFLFIFVILFITINSCYSASCAVGQAGCMASCMAQNCASGMCYPQSAPRTQQTCKCVRCVGGPRW